MNDIDASAAVLTTLRQIVRAMDIHSRHLSKQVGLTGPQLIVIREIKQNGPMVIGELSRSVSLSQATVTTILDRLERAGMATRVRDDRDKRRVYVDITDRASEILAGQPNFLHDRFLKRFGALESWEQTLILSSIQRLAAMMNAGDLPDEIQLAPPETTDAG